MESIASNSRDGRFMKALTQLVLDNLGNEQFSVEKLAEGVGVSRSQLHKKLKKTTGKSVSQYIREIRLDEAMKLLQQDVATVSEISYQVGFSSPTYFNTCFKEYFGYPPGEVKVRVHLNDESSNANELVRDPNPRRRLTLLFSAIGVLVAIMGIFYLFNRSASGPNLVSELNDTVPSAPQDQTIAVLPLKNWSGDPEMDYISDGLTDAIIIKLLQIESIRRVIPFTSVLHYKQTAKPISEIAKELGVKNVLQGSFQLSGNEVSVKVQLIDGINEDHFWEGEYKRNWESTEIFSIQSAVAEDVAKNIDAIITDTEKESIHMVPTLNKEAYKLYLQAEYRFGQLSLKGINDSQSLYSRAIALDSTFIEPYIGLATSHLLTGLVWGMTSEAEAWSKAKPIYLKALEIDRANFGDQRKWIKIGLIQGLFLYEWDLESYEEVYKDSPDNTALYIPFSGSNNGDYARKTGRFEDVLEIANNIMGAYPTAIEGYIGKACALYFLGRYKEAKAILAENDDLNSDNYFYLMETAKYYHYLGEDKKSKKHLELFKQQFSDRPPIILWLTAIHAEMDGNVPEVQKTLNELKELYKRKSSGSPAWFTALYYCHIKDHDMAFEWLQKSYDHHEVEMTWLKEEPELRPLRDDPRYIDLYNKVGFNKLEL